MTICKPLIVWGWPAFAFCKDKNLQGLLVSRNDDTNIVIPLP